MNSVAQVFGLMFLTGLPCFMIGYEIGFRDARKIYNRSRGCR